MLPSPSPPLGRAHRHLSTGLARALVLPLALAFASCSETPTEAIAPLLDLPGPAASEISTEAGQKVLAGPVLLKVREGTSQAYSFDVHFPSEGPRPPFHLVIGPVKGLSSPSEVWIAMDGKDVVTPATFDPSQDPNLRVEILPGATATFDVVVSGNPGSGVRASIETAPNLLPTAAFTPPPPFCTTGRALALDARGSSDPDGSIVAYEWDLSNDGTLDATGVATTFTAPFIAPAVSYDHALTVVDDRGGRNTVVQTYTCLYEEPDVSLGIELQDPSGAPVSEVVQGQTYQYVLTATNHESVPVGYLDIFVQLDHKAQTPRVTSGLTPDVSSAGALTYLGLTLAPGETVTSTVEFDLINPLGDASLFSEADIVQSGQPGRNATSSATIVP